MQISQKLAEIYILLKSENLHKLLLLNRKTVCFTLLVCRLGKKENIFLKQKNASIVKYSVIFKKVRFLFDLVSPSKCGPSRLPQCPIFSSKHVCSPLMKNRGTQPVFCSLDE